MTDTLKMRFAENALSTEQSVNIQGGITFVMTTRGCVPLKPKPKTPVKFYPVGGWRYAR